MPTKNPRINVSVEGPIYQVIQALASEEGVSMSSLAQELIREALEIREDVGLSALADKRDATLDRSTLLTHEETWD